MAEQLPMWNNPGIEPSTDLKVNGWQPGQKPSAQHFNWLFNRAYKCLEDLQNNKADKTAITNLSQTLSDLEESFTSHLADTAKHPYVSVDSFGAAGDGATDDTTAIQNAVNSITGVGILTFTPGKTYKISGTINIDVAHVRGIIGNNAYIKQTVDAPALQISGSLTTGTVTPGNPNTDSIKNTEMMPLVSGLQIYSNGSPYIGVGIQVQNVFGIILRDLHLYNLGTGLKFANRNRNVIVDSIHIWDCKDYGIHFSAVNQHQTNIANSHLSWAGTALIFVDEGDVHNLQITGNNIENGPGYNIRLKATSAGTQVSQVQIVGNSIEAHMLNTNPLLSIEGNSATLGAGYAGIVEISANEFSSSAEPAIKISKAYGVSITGNTFFGIDDYAIHVINGVEDLTVFGNIFNTSMDLERYMGAFKAELTTLSGMIMFDNNIIAQAMINPFQLTIDGTFLLFEVSVCNNIFQLASNRPGTPPAITGYLVDINAGSSAISGLKFCGNGIRGRTYTDNGVRIKGGSYEKVIIKDNYVRGLDSGKTAYSIPSAVAGNIVNSDNI